MAEAQPYVLLSVATSVDGYIDDASADRLLLSTTWPYSAKRPTDHQRCMALRASQLPSSWAAWTITMMITTVTSVTGQLNCW